MAISFLLLCRSFLAVAGAIRCEAHNVAPVFHTAPNCLCFPIQTGFRWFCLLGLLLCASARQLPLRRKGFALTTHKGQCPLTSLSFETQVRRRNATLIHVRKRMRRVRHIATNITVLPDGSLLCVNEQGQVPLLGIRCRAIHVRISC